VVLQIVPPDRVDEPGAVRLQQHRHEHRRLPRACSRRRDARHPLPRFHVYRREALVNLAPGIEWTRRRLAQPRRHVCGGALSVSSSVHQLIIIHRVCAAARATRRKRCCACQMATPPRAAVVAQGLLLSTASMSRATAAVQDCS
jgi:hypothetical protein